MKPRGGEGQNGRLKCPMGFLVFNEIGLFLRKRASVSSYSDIPLLSVLAPACKKLFSYLLVATSCLRFFLIKFVVVTGKCKIQ